MADNTINVRIKDRSDTEANWTSKNPVLLKGERAITDGTGKYKIGDGKNTWGALPYYEAMTSADRTKLNGIAPGANKTTVDSSLSSSSTNPVQNKVVNSALAGKSNTNHTHDLSTMINTLSTSGSTPTDDDYFVSQYAGGGTTTTTYHRRPVKALLEYIKGKLAKVATSGSYDDLSNKPTIPTVGNGTITIKQAGAVKGSFTTNQSGATTIELTDNNTDTWRGIQDNLTSTSTTDSLSANQGKILNESKLMHKTINTSKTDLNTLTETGIYHIVITDALNAPTPHHGTLYVDTTVGTKYQVFMSDAVTNYMHKRYYDNDNKEWFGWIQLKFTDTVYTHPSYTAKSNGLYKVTVDDKGHVSGTTAVAKSDITALGIPSTNTTYSTGTASTSGLTKLYTGTGTATDGTMNQAAIKSALDGKSDSSHTHRRTAYVGSDTANTSGWYKVADQTMSGYENSNILFAVTNTYGGNLYGLFTLRIRSNNTNITCDQACWLTRTGFPADSIIVNVSGMKWTMYVNKTVSQYGRIQFEILSEGSINNVLSNAVLYNSSTPESTKPTATVTSYDNSIVNYANSAGAVAWGNVTGKPSTFTPSSHTHDDRYYTESEMDSKLDTKLSKTGGTITGGTIAMDGGGLPTFNGNRVAASNVAIGKNGFAISGVSTSNDGAAIFMESSSQESNKLIFALGDDADETQNGKDDYIAFRYYNTSGNVTYESKIPNKTGTIALTSDIPASMAWGSITDKPSTYTPSSHTHGNSDITSVDASKITGTIDIATNALKVNNHTVNADVPSGAKFTDTVYSHPTTSGNKHIPSGGSSGQILRWSSDGTAVWGNDNNTTYTLSSITGTLAVSKGGTGSTTAAGGRSNLGAVGFVCQSAEPSDQNNGDLWFKEG